MVLHRKIPVIFINRNMDFSRAILHQWQSLRCDAPLKNTGNSVDEQNSVEKLNEVDDEDKNDADICVIEEDILISENISNDEQNSSVDDLNSSREELTTNDDTGDQKSEDKNENPVKRSKRERSAKTYTDFIK
jgi:hypothetical protein